MPRGIEDPSTLCDICKRLPVVWHLINTTDNWDFYRAYCSGPCERSILISKPPGSTNLPSQKVRRGQQLTV
jgi:hypothetical protein